MSALTLSVKSSLTSRGASRAFSRSALQRNASQPAPPSTSQNPHAARVAAASSSSSGGGDARSRLAKLQAQRLEELNRGKSGSSSGAGRPGNKPEQKWSNRTLIALATSVGACTYLMGTYHGYNAGKKHAEEELQAGAATPSGAPLEGEGGLPTSVPSGAGATVTGPRKGVQGSVEMGSLSSALSQLIPFGSMRSSILCEPEKSAPTQPNCRLAELTQYHCDLHTDRVVCQPIDRIFRILEIRSQFMML
uniref:Uncharacterized protein n=1 Tax=Kalmanozyma brasiliensis (strain GHG001) TaxID=1365824 RepID=V5ELB1_KALBG